MKDVKYVTNQLIPDMFVVIYQEVLQNRVEIHCFDTRRVWYIVG